MSLPLVSIPSRSGLLQNTFHGAIMVRGRRFNPFSFRSPSKLGRFRECECSFRVSIPSRSGLLQNGARRQVESNFCFNPFSFRSPSKQIKRLFVAAAKAFQSLLVQVSFKTGGAVMSTSLPRFNPFSFRSPSKRWIMRVDTCRCVSIPSRSGLLQNAGCE